MYFASVKYCGQASIIVAISATAVIKGWKPKGLHKLALCSWVLQIIEKKKCSQSCINEFPFSKTFLPIFVSMFFLTFTYSHIIPYWSQVHTIRNLILKNDHIFMNKWMEIVIEAKLMTLCTMDWAVQCSSMFWNCSFLKANTKRDFNNNKTWIFNWTFKHLDRTLIEMKTNWKNLLP